MRLYYECKDPSKKTAYTNTKDLAYPPKPRPTKITLRWPYSSEIREVLRDTAMTFLACVAGAWKYWAQNGRAKGRRFPGLFIRLVVGTARSST